MVTTLLLIFAVLGVIFFVLVIIPPRPHNRRPAHNDPVYGNKFVDREQVHADRQQINLPPNF